MDLVKMQTPQLDADYDSINIAGDYARQVVGLDDFQELVGEYDFDRAVDYGEDRVLIEMAASVLNGEHPEVNPSVEYDPDNRLNGDDFVELALELSGYPSTGRKELSELRDTTQVGDEEIPGEQVRAIRNMLINKKFYEHNKEEDSYNFRISFYSFEDGETSIDFVRDHGETMDMEDRIEALEDDRDFEEWP